MRVDGQKPGTRRERWTSGRLTAKSISIKDAKRRPGDRAWKATELTPGHRLLWLFLLPFGITAAMVPMFFVLNARITDVEVLAKQLNIERYLLVDKNYAMAIDQYREILKTKQNASILSRLGVLYFQLDHKNLDTAIGMLNAAKRSDPGYWEIYRNLSFIYSTLA
jgi:tetratricopeptide (TPR) repeat protein